MAKFPHQRAQASGHNPTTGEWITAWLTPDTAWRVVNGDRLSDQITMTTQTKSAGQWRCW